MPKRYHIAFTSKKGEDWTLEIHDTDHVGASTEVDGRFNGFGFDWEALDRGDQADMFTPILGSSANFDMLIESAGMETFVDDLNTSREKRFHLVIYREAALYWVGYIVADEVRVSDRYYPFNLSLFAIDGLSRLKEIDYKDPTSGNKYTGRETAISHFYNIIDILDLDGVVTMPTTIFRTNFNWYSDSMSTGSGNNGLTQFDIDHERFYGTDDNGNEFIWNAYDVLQSLCRALGGRFFFTDGQWWFMQPAEYTDSTQTVWGFNASKVQTSYNTGTDYDLSIDYVNRQKETGGSWTYLRAMKKVRVDYNHLSTYNRALGLTWDHDNGPTGFVQLPGKVQVDNANESQIRLRVPVTVQTELTLTSGINIYPPHRYNFRIHLRIGGYYLKRSTTNDFYSIEADEAFWTTTAQYIETHSPEINSNNNDIPVTFVVDIKTPYLETAVSNNFIELKIELVDAATFNGTAIMEPTGPYYTADLDWKAQDVEVRVLEEGVGDAPARDIRRFEEEDNTEGNTGIYAVDTFLGDGPFPWSVSRLTDTSADTKNWGVGVTSGTVAISLLLAQQILNLRQQPAKLYQGVYLARDIHPYSRIVDLTEAFVPMRINFSAYLDKWGGDFVRVETGVFTTTTTVSNPGGGIPSNPSPPIVVGTSGINDNTTKDEFSGPGTSNIIANSQNQLSPTTLNGDILDTTVDPTVTISAVGYSFVKQGDSIQVVNPGTGNAQTFTVTATPQPNATSLQLTGTATADFPPGSYIQPLPSVNMDRGFTYLVRNHSNEVLNIPSTSGTLPDPTVVGSDECLRRVEVMRGSIRNYYDSANDYQNGFSISGNRITFTLKPRNEDIFVRVIP